MVRALRMTPSQLNAMLSGSAVPAWPLPLLTTPNRRRLTMKNKRIFKTFSALCAALVLMASFSVTAFAQGRSSLRQKILPMTVMWWWRKPRTVRP